MNFSYILLILLTFIFTGCSNYNIQTSIPIKKQITKPILLDKEYKNYNLSSSSFMYSQYKNKVKENESILNTTVFSNKNKKTYEGSIGNSKESYSFKAKQLYEKSFQTIITKDIKNKNYSNFLKTLIKKELQKFECNPSNLALKTNDKAMDIKDLTSTIKRNPLIAKFMPKRLFYTVKGLGEYEGKEVIISNIDIKKSDILVDAKTNLNLSFFIKGILLHEVPFKTPRKYNLKIKFDLYTYKAYPGEYFKQYSYKEKVAEVINVGEVNILEFWVF